MTFKKSLILSTALTAVGALAATSAIAAEKPKIKLSGYQETYFGFSNDRKTAPTGTPTYQDSGDGAFGIVQYGEIRITATGMTDSGMKWGVRFEDVQDESDRNGGSLNKKQSTDEAHLWIEGSWGRLEIGGQDGAADRERENSEELFPYDRRFAAVFTNTRGRNLRGAEGYGSLNDSSDDTKLTYWTPRVSGFRAAYSYAPHAGARGSVLTTDEPFHEAAISYRGKIGGGTLRAAAGYTLEANAQPDGDDLDAWRIGANYSHSGFTVAAGYVDKGEERARTSGEEGHAWDVGVTYEQGPWLVGIAYLSAEHDVRGFTDDEYTQISLMGAYNLGGGLALSGGVLFVDLDSSTHPSAPASNDDIVGVFKITATF